LPETVLGQLVEELDLARVLAGCHSIAAKADEFFRLGHRARP
jgi:hypothetical protein